jgi:hypothetical protein
MNESIENMLTSAATRLEANLQAQPSTVVPWDNQFEIAASNPDALRSSTGTLHTHVRQNEATRTGSKLRRRVIALTVGAVLCLGLVAAVVHQSEEPTVYFDNGPLLSTLP